MLCALTMPYNPENFPNCSESIKGNKSSLENSAVWAHIRVRSPLLTKYLIGLFSSRYWDVSLPEVCSLHYCKVVKISLYGVSPFGNFRIKGCLAPPRNISPPRRVLHRLLKPRHPPYALIVSFSQSLRDGSLRTAMICCSTTTARSTL